MSCFLRNQKGFTILEAVFAAGILAFAILSYTLLKTSSRHSQVYSKNLSQAIQLSQRQMDDFTRLGYNHTLLEAGTHVYSELPTTLGIGDFVLDDATWTVKNVFSDGSTKLIEFTGKWNVVGDDFKEFKTTKVVRP
ncbi:MAG: hypothetical protein R6W72_11540 [Desulfurivibrionaceae bacterium]